MRRIAIFVFFCAAFSGCATGYHSVNNPLLGWMGGFWDKKGPGELIEVGFSGNNFVEKDKVGIYLLYRCAEITHNKQKGYFTMYASISDAIIESPLTGSIGFQPAGHVYLLLQNDQLINQHGQPFKAFSVNEVMEKYKDQIKTI